MLKIRLQRIGRRNNPSYRIVVIESAVAAKKGIPVELLGTYDTIRKKTALKEDRIRHWIAKGAQVSDTMNNILITNGVIQGVKKNVLPKKNPIKKAEEETKETAQKPVSADMPEKESLENSKETPSTGG